MRCNVVNKFFDLQTHKERLKHWLLMGFSLFVLGIILHFTNGTYPCIFILQNGMLFTVLEVRFYMHCSALAALPINKQLYSFSYVCFTGGAAGIVLSAFYILVWFMCNFFTRKFFNFMLRKKIKNIHPFFYGQIDVWGLRTPFLFLEWIGMNAMLVFVLGAQGILAAFVNGWYYESPDKSLVSNGWRLIWLKNMVCLSDCP